MGKIRFALIGAGWRAQFFIRIAKALPESFELTGVLVRDPMKGSAFAENWQVKVVSTLEELLKDSPDFVVLSIRRGEAADYLIRLFRMGVPVLAETPPGETFEKLNELWRAYEQYQPKVQVAEQYFLQPLYAAWYQAIQEGLIGEVTNISISALHGYHAVSMIRRMLGIKGETCVMYGKRYSFPVTQTYSRAGMTFDGEVTQCSRDRVVFEFENGKTAFFDFAGSVQYHSFIRTRQLNIQGTRGEIDDLTIRYLLPSNIPVTEELRRIDLGVYGNQEWAHYGIMLGERFLYQNPFENARLNDDEIAIAGLLLGMGRYVAGGDEIYPLSQALQDTYLSLKMEEALKTPYQPVKTLAQIWS
ncbi:MAG: Gfo/Idh/MocA family oxidoreductase [Blautia sp.]|nr:Gfo/Idh/MocA family oxidoreductase [Blautia sp.]